MHRGYEFATDPDRLAGDISAVLVVARLGYLS